MDLPTNLLNNSIIGLSFEKANQLLLSNGYNVRVVKINGRETDTTSDKMRNRVNLSVQTSYSGLKSKNWRLLLNDKHSRVQNVEFIG